MSELKINSITVANTIYANSIVSTYTPTRVINTTAIPLGDTPPVYVPTNWTRAKGTLVGDFSAIGSYPSLAYSVLGGQEPKFSIAYGDGVFIAIDVLDSYFTVCRSTDGFNWNISNPLGSSVASNFSVAFGNGVFVAVGTSGFRAVSIDYGSTWSYVTSYTDPLQSYGAVTWTSVAYGNGYFLAAGYTQGPGKSGTYLPSMAYSAEGFIWLPITDRTVTEPYFKIAKLYSINPEASYNKRYTGPMAYGKGIFVPADGAGDFGPQIYSITYGNNYFISVDYAGNVRSSSDGLSWSGVQYNFPSVLNADPKASGGGVRKRSLGYGNGMLLTTATVGIDVGGNINDSLAYVFSSTDPQGKSWKMDAANPLYNVGSTSNSSSDYGYTSAIQFKSSEIAYGNNTFVVTGLHSPSYWNTAYFSQPPFYASNTFIKVVPGIVANGSTTSLNLLNDNAFMVVNSTPSFTYIRDSSTRYSGFTRDGSFETCNVQIFTANGFWQPPQWLLDSSGLYGNGHSLVIVHAWGGGGSGAGDGAGSIQGGGGGGAFTYGIFPFLRTQGTLYQYYPVIVGNGGAARNPGDNLDGNPGGFSSFGSISSFGGASAWPYFGEGNPGYLVYAPGGSGGSFSYGGSGGGWITKGEFSQGSGTNRGGLPENGNSTITDSYGFGGGAGGDLAATTMGGSSIYGGGGGGMGATYYEPGSSIYGGGGGAWKGTSETGIVGTSLYGGRGGNTSVAASTPGGGGAPLMAGARGEVRVYAIRDIFISAR